MNPEREAREATESPGGSSAQRKSQGVGKLSSRVRVSSVRVRVSVGVRAGVRVMIRFKVSVRVRIMGGVMVRG